MDGESIKGSPDDAKCKEEQEVAKYKESAFVVEVTESLKSVRKKSSF